MYLIRFAQPDHLTSALHQIKKNTGVQPHSIDTMREGKQLIEHADGSVSILLAVVLDPHRRSNSEWMKIRPYVMYGHVVVSIQTMSVVKHRSASDGEYPSVLSMYDHLPLPVNVV